MQIPKFIKDIKKYFMYEGSATPTTQDDLQAYMKNEHETLECLWMAYGSRKQNIRKVI